MKGGGNMKNINCANPLFGLSVAAAVLSGYASVYNPVFGLAGTQWMLLAILFAVWAIFRKK